AVRRGPRALRGDHGGESCARHGDAALRRELVRSLHRCPASARAHDTQPGAFRAGDLRLSDHHHLRASAVALLQAPGLRLMVPGRAARPGGPAHGGEGSGEYRCPLGPERGAQGHRVGLGGFQNGGSSSRSAAAVVWVAAALVAFLAAAFLAVFCTAFLAALAALAAVVLAVLLAVVLPGFSARGSNSNPILPSFCATKYALNLR